MTSNTVKWPEANIAGVRLVERGGAWFVHFEGPDGARQRILKTSGREKGFRCLDPLVTRLRFLYGVKVFEVCRELPQRFCK